MHKTCESSSSHEPSICFVSHSPSMYGLLQNVPGTPTGGAELQQIMISRILREKGLPSEFVVYHPGRTRVETTADGMRVILGIQPPKGGKFIRALKPMLSTFRSLKAASADVYYHRGTGPVIGYVALYCTAKRVPFVFACANITNLDRSCERTMTSFQKLLYRFAIKRAACVIVQTHDQERMLLENYGRKGVLVRNMRAVPEDADPCSDRSVILWVGRFCRNKRPEMFFELASRFPQYSFVMVGGRFGLEPEVYDSAVEKASALDNVTLAGQVSFEEMNSYYKRASMLVSTSRAEGFPNIFLEAWSYGTPTISTFDADGLISEYGLGCYCKDLDDLSEKLACLAEDRKMRVDIGTRAIEYVRTHHSPETIASQLVGVLKSAANKCKE